MSALPALIGGVLDQLLGEPPVAWHPVARYGTAMGAIEQRMYADRRITGTAFAAIGLGIGLGTGIALRKVVGPTAATIVATAACAAGKMLDNEASKISDLLAVGDIVGARQQLRSLVGRTTDDLNESEISRAVIESVAETLSMRAPRLCSGPRSVVPRPCWLTGRSTPSTQWSATTPAAMRTSDGRAPVLTTSPPTYPPG